MISSSLKKRFVTSIILLFLIYFMFRYDFVLIFSLIILGIGSVLEFFAISKKILKHRFYLFVINLSFTLYISIFCMTFFLFSNFLYLKIIIFSILFACIASDIGGFVFGKIFKGKKLTKLSPNKTISGAIGSVLFSFIIFSLLIYFFTNKLGYEIITIGIFISIFCQGGDLFFSYLKRKAKLKDTGKILPGHGGILDRVDGILLGVPFGFLSISIFF